MSTPRFLTLPPGVRRIDVETDRGAFAALEGLPGSRACERHPALLVPGFTGSKEDFLAVLQTLAAAGRRVVAIDMRGQYETPGPDDPGAYPAEELAADIESVVLTFAEPPHLLGHSFGGLVARDAALAKQAPLTSLTLMSSGAGAITGPKESEARALLAALRPPDGRPAMTVTEIWQAVLEPAALAKGTPEDIVAFLRRRMLGNNPASLIGMCEQLVGAPDRVAELTSVPLPMLVLYGEDDDNWTPRHQASMAERLAAERVVIPGAAHSPAVDAPETTAGALTEFWNAAERAAP